MMSMDASPRRSVGALDLILYSAAVALGVLLWTITRIVAVFDPAGVAFTLPVAASPVEVALEGESWPSERALTEAAVLVPDLDAAGRIFLVVAAVLTLAGTLVIVAALVRLALEFRAGRFFSRRVTRALTAIGAAAFGTGLLVMLCNAMARGSAMEALDLAFEPLHMLDLVAYAPAWITAVIAGVLASAFAHGERLQRDVRGLV